MGLRDNGYVCVVLLLGSTPVIRFFFLIKLTDALISQIYFVKKLYIFRTVPLPIIRSLLTVH